MFENPRRGRQARNFTTNVPKILDLKSSSEQIFSENWRWVPLPKFPSLFQAFRSWGQRKEMWVEKKQQQQRGGEVGVRALLRPLSLSLFSSLFFSRSLPSRHTPLSERLEQPINSRTYCKKTDLQSPSAVTIIPRSQRLIFYCIAFY